MSADQMTAVRLTVDLSALSSPPLDAAPGYEIWHAGCPLQECEWNQNYRGSVECK
jgi:hypothetical protein